MKTLFDFSVGQTVSIEAILERKKRLNRTAKVPSWKSPDGRLRIIYDFHPEDPGRRHTQYFYEGEEIDLLGWPCKDEEEAEVRTADALEWYEDGFFADRQGVGSMFNLIRIADGKWFGFTPAPKHFECCFFCETERKVLEKGGYFASFRVTHKADNREDAVKWMSEYK